MIGELCENNDKICQLMIDFICMNPRIMIDNLNLNDIILNDSILSQNITHSIIRSDYKKLENMENEYWLIWLKEHYITCICNLNTQHNSHNSHSHSPNNNSNNNSSNSHYNSHSLYPRILLSCDWTNKITKYLYYACKNESWNIILLVCLFFKIQPPYGNDDPLIYAVKCNKYEIVKILLDCGIPASNKPQIFDEFSAMTYACKYGNIQIIKLLLQYNGTFQLSCSLTNDGNTGYQRESDWSDLMHVCHSDYANDNITKQIGHLIIQQYLINKTHSNHNNYDGTNKNDDYTRASLIIKRKLSNEQIMLYTQELLNGKDTLGWTPLHFAVFKNKIQTIQWLLNLGCDKHSINQNNQTPLDIAIKYNYTQAIQLLSNSNHTNHFK